MNFLKSYTAFILAGGKSSRMGEDKGMVLFKGKEMVVWMIELLKPHFKEVCIISNNPAYAKFNLPVHSDLIKNQGPLGGLYTGLTYSSTPWNLFLACDMPFMNMDIIQHLAAGLKEYDAVVPFQNEHPEPLCAFYNKSCLPVIENQLQNGDNKIQDFYKLVNSNYINIMGLYSSVQNPFHNINTKEELKNSALQ
ncbi:MAG TPA: molybdenum cofactor guanylyltransferase [Bacteroidia bacterium]|nr:molybdenum cofactor guanylyltransferase [Bacteroidia bacterium]